MQAKKPKLSRNVAAAAFMRAINDDFLYAAATFMCVCVRIERERDRQ